MTGSASRRCRPKSRGHRARNSLSGQYRYLSLLPLVVRDQLGGGPLAYGALMAGFGTGAFFGGVSNAMFRRSLSQERLMTLSCVACAACSLSLALTIDCGGRNRARLGRRGLGHRLVRGW
ncbi:MFS transporter [Mesorhizobium sp. M0309]|uniref:MFS transporter n=1 Tax=Mesorhizobium sp. M0309 TaxID=2956933 RepID=UPI00333D7B73